MLTTAACEAAGELMDANSEDIERDFGGWAVERQLFDYILSVLPDGKTVLELGSGWATGELVKHYTVYSVEHDKKWLNRFDSHYIYALLVNGWYDVNVLKTQLPHQYDLILIDGPVGINENSRYGFYTNLALFKTNCIMIFDDVNRKGDYKLFTDVAGALNRPFEIVKGRSKNFGVIMPSDSLATPA